jgi:hypothetical protein
MAGCFLFATLALIFLKKKNISFETMMKIMVVVTILSELGKVFARIEVADGRAMLPTEFLPLHLCSIQVFLIWYLRYLNKSEKVKNILLGFMYPTCFLGGLLALIIATVTPVSFSNPEIYEYFFYHTWMVILGLWIPLTKQVHITFKTALTTTKILLIVFFLSIYFNSMLSQSTVTNFFYSSFPPLEGLPYLNFKWFGQTLANEKMGWFAYIIKLMFLGVVLFVAAFLPFILKNRSIEKQIIA